METVTWDLSVFPSVEVPSICQQGTGALPQWGSCVCWTLELGARLDPLQAACLVWCRPAVCALCVADAWDSHRSCKCCFFCGYCWTEALQSPPASWRGQNYQRTNAFFPSSVASCCLILSIPELHEFCRDNCWVMLLPTKPPKTKLTLLPLTIGLVFWLWVGGAELPSMERVLDYCWAAECPLLLSSVTCQACSLSLIL